MRKVNYFTVQNIEWDINRNDDGTYPQGDARLAVLMDIREELHKLNTLLNCKNFVAIPEKLDRIARNIQRKKPAQRK
jgi:hypothetical protein